MGVQTSMASSGVMVTEGFDAFRRGVFGNGGQNIYVSRAGVLQRIHQFDLDRDGYLDLIICNSQPHGEQPPSFLYSDPLGKASRIELPSDGAWSGTVADFNGDGYDDIVIGMLHNGARGDLNAFVYYGGDGGFSERRHQLLPAPACVSIAAGDFDGDGRPDLAMVCGMQSGKSEGNVRVFYQTELGLEPKRFVDLPIAASQVDAEDLDGDGYADLVVRTSDGKVAVYWGGPEGIDTGVSTPVPVAMDEPDLSPEEEAREALHSEYNRDAPPLVKVLRLRDGPHVFVARHRSVSLVPILPGRVVGTPTMLDCPRAMAAAVGDIDGDGFEDLVVATRQSSGEGECSWVYWGGESGFDQRRRAMLASNRACDVVVVDLDADGLDDVVLCQCHTDESFTTDSFSYRGARDRSIGQPVALEGYDPRRVFPVRSPDADRPDLLFVNHYSRKIFEVSPTIYYGGPNGFAPERSQEVRGVGAVEAICCDLNDDGLVDLVLANSAHNCDSRDPGSFVYLAGADGFPKEPSIVLPTRSAHGGGVGDLDHDGYLDLVVTGYFNPDMLIFRGGPDGFDTANPQRIRMERDGVVYDYCLWLALADLNNDGWLDIIAPQGNGHERCLVLWGGPDGYSMERVQLLAAFNTMSARAADLTGNGYLDLIVGGAQTSPEGPHDSFVSVYWNGPDGLSDERKTMLPANHVNAMSIADFNNDGLPDLFVCSYADGRVRDLDSYIYWNREGRGFSAADRTRLFTHSATGCMAADFDEDGWIDLAVANHKVWGDQVAYSEVWWNGPDGFSKERTTRLPSQGPHGMSAAGTSNAADGGPEEYYVSAPFELPDGARAAAVSWDADVPAKTWVKAQLRAADTAERLEREPWPAGWLENGGRTSAPGKWAQYRLALGAVNSGRTPRVARVEVRYEV